MVNHGRRETLVLVCEGKEIPRGSLGLVLSQYMEKVPVRVFHSGSPDCHRDPDEGGFQKNWSLIHRGASFFSYEASGSG